jgi:hypothetical protein
MMKSVWLALGKTFTRLAASNRDLSRGGEVLTTTDQLIVLIDGGVVIAPLNSFRRPPAPPTPVPVLVTVNVTVAPVAQRALRRERHLIHRDHWPS